MSESDHVRIAEEIFADANAHTIGSGNTHYTDDFRQEAPGAAGALTREQAQAQIQGFITAFPDLHFDLRHKIAQGDFVVINWVATGTHTGPLTTPTGAQIPPTGKKALVPGSTTYQFKNGKASRAWVHWDMVTLLAQLGLMPAM